MKKLLESQSWRDALFYVAVYVIWTWAAGAFTPFPFH